jgi:hypothetical protein
MDALDYWKLCERTTIFQATMLIIGCDPRNMTSSDIERDDFHSSEKVIVPDGYGAVKTALLDAAREGLMGIKIEEIRNYDETGDPVGWVPGSIDIDKTFISLAQIRAYLKERNFPSNFFSPEIEASSPDYLNPGNPCYAPKLAAAVEAWTVVTGEKKHETESTPKQLMEKWLRENATRFGLNKADGKLNEDAIAQITKIANWRPEGGASKSPGSKNPTTPKKRAK